MSRVAASTASCQRRAEAVAIGLRAMGEDDAPRIVHHRPQALGVEGAGHVAGRPALAAEAGHEKQRVRHGGAQLGQLGRIGGAGHRAHAP